MFDKERVQNTFVCLEIRNLQGIVDNLNCDNEDATDYYVGLCITIR